jgi:hypothetical protein
MAATMPRVYEAIAEELSSFGRKPANRVGVTQP